MTDGIFVTSTGTACGKTWVSRAITRALRRGGSEVVAVKPIETGCRPTPLDAVDLARACGRPAAATAPGLYRAELPLAPRGVSLALGSPAPDITTLVAATRALAPNGEFLLVEGAGGLLTPLDASHTIADLAQALELPLLVVAPDALGVISHVLTLLESAEARALPIVGVVLSAHATRADDPSARTNRAILTERVRAPVLTFPVCADDDDALADAAAHAGLIELLTP